MARLEIEIAGVNAELKRILKESKIELSNFSKGLNFDNRGISKTNDSLTSTKKLLQDITKLSGEARASLKGLSGNELKAANSAAKVAIAEARAEQAKYRAETIRLTNELKAQKVAQAQANTETAKARNSAQQYTADAARLRSELAALRLKQAQSRTETKAASGSYREAQQTLTALGRSIREAAGGFNSTNPAIKDQIRQYRELNSKLKEFDAQMGNHQRNVGNYTKALQGLKGLAASYFGFTSLIQIGRQVLNSNAAITDSLADVRRTAGLTAKEAENLSEKLKLIDTRTSLKGLLDIAVIAGQLGIAKTQLAGFTKAIDQLAVTLGGELSGGPEGIAKSLGVLDNVFGVTKDNAGDVEKAYNQIGSAILGLGQSGLATGSFLADFGERVGGLAKQAGLSLPVILSYGAVLQENGVNAEVAGTAFKRLLSALSTNSTKFFAVAQMADANLTLKDFNTLVNTDTKRALDLFFAGLKKGGTSTIAFNSILKTLKLSQAGVSQSIAAISNNLPALNKHIEESTKDFNAATLSGEQFLIKNNNLAGSVDKLAKSFENATTSGVISNFFKQIIDGAAGAVNGINKMSEALSIFYNLATRPKQFIGESAISPREQANQSTIQNARKSAATQVKNQVGQKEAFELVKREAALLGEINDKYKEQKAIFDSLDSGDRTLAQVEAFQKLENSVRFQKALVAGLKVEYDKLYRTVKRSDAATPEGFVTGPKGKKVGGGGGTGTTSADILAKSVASSAIAEEEPGVDKLLERLKQRYIGYYDDLDKLAAKKGADRAKIESDRAAIRENEIRERGAIELAEVRRVEGERQRILDAAGVKAAENIQKDLLAIDAKYAEEVKKARGNELLLSAISAASEAERNAVFEKYADKRADAEKEIYDKINDVTEQGFTENLKRTVKGSQRIDSQLQDRLAKLRKYFAELQALNATNPLGQIALGIAEKAQVDAITSQADGAKNPKTNLNDLFDQDLNGAIRKFGDDFVNTLKNINREADETFGSVLGRLGTSLWESLGEATSDIFINQFKQQFSDAIKSASSKLSTELKGAIAVSGLLGGAISGLTKKTSGVGQGIGGALTGAATGAGAAIGIGAALGSAAGPLGIGIGAAVGGLVGLFKGIFGAKKARKEEAIQAAQLAEQQKQTKLLERQNALAYASSIIGQQTNQGIVTGIERDATGNLVAKVAGKDMLLILERAQQDKKRGIL